MNKQSLITVVCLVLGWWGISLMKSLSTTDGSLKLPVEEIEARKAAERSVAEMKTAPSEVAAMIPPPAVSSKPPVLFESQAELNVYAALKAKVLPSDSEKSERQSLVNNGRLLASIANRLTTIPLMALGEQDVAIDLLVEAFKSGDKQAAEVAMRAVVTDAQVENAKLDREVREQLAGIKAEVLYHWAALAPEAQDTIAHQLPGPASLKIWKNVQDSHASNLAESRAEER